MQKYTIYHPNAKGTGSALSLTPCITDEITKGYLILGITQQTSIDKDVESKPTSPIFDWDKRTEVRLNPMDVMEIIRVFKGEQESINDGKGLRSRDDKCTVDVHCHFDPVPHYAVTFTTTEQNGEKTTRSISLTLTEAETIYIALTYAMGPMVFGQ